MSHVFGQSADQFIEMILKKFFFDQVDEDRTKRVEMVAELLCEMPFPTESEAEQASYRLEAFANLYGPNNSKDLQIRTKVSRYADKDWGVECDYRQAGSSRGARSGSAGVLGIDEAVSVRRSGTQPVPVRTLVTIGRQGRGRSGSAEKWVIPQISCRVELSQCIAGAAGSGVSGSAWRSADSSRAVTA